MKCAVVTVAEGRRIFAQIVASQLDMRPAQGRDMRQECFVDFNAGVSKVIGGAAKVERVPVSNGGDEQVEA